MSRPGVPPISCIGQRLTGLASPRSGAVGHVCAVPNGVAGCSGGQCFAASCAQGYTSAGTQCVKMDLSSDASNCGARKCFCFK